MKQTSNRLNHIDSLRGIAALYVMAGHAMTDYLFKMGAHVSLPFELLKQFTSAQAGVMLFFAISGFVIPSSFVGEGSQAVRHFLVRRFFRLFPIYWVALIPSLIVLFVFKNPINSFGVILSNFTMVPKLFDQKFVLHVAWTLAHELLFYSMCLLLFLCGWLRESRKIASVILSLCALFWLIKLGEWVGLWGAPTSFFQKTVWISIPLMFWGTLWRYMQEGKCKGRLETFGLMCIPLQGLVLLISRLFYTTESVRANFPVSFASSIVLGIAIFMVGTIRFKITNRFLVWCGTVSYSIYLFHMYAIVYVMKFFAYFYTGMPPFTLIVVLAGVVSCLIGGVGYYLIERPSILLAKRVTAKRVSDFS